MALRLKIRRYFSSLVRTYFPRFYIFTASKQVYWKICIFVSVRG